MPPSESPSAAEDSRSGLTARARMPVQLVPRDGDAPTPFVSLLRRLIDVGGLGGVQEPDDNETDSAAAAEHLRRLHTKVDLLLWMGAELLAIHRPLPPSQAVCLESDAVLLEADGSAEPDKRQWLLLYCLDGLPMPLPLPVTVIAAEGQLRCRLDSPDGQTAELYSQLLFRLHRREIAARRSG